VGGQDHAPVVLSPGMIQWLDGGQGRCGQVREIFPTPGFDLRTGQPIASRLHNEMVQFLERH